MFKISICMKQVYSLYECSDRAMRMIPHSRFPILALPAGVWSEYTAWAKSYYIWAPPKQFCVASSENTDFLKKLFNMKIFCIKFVSKKVTFIFSVRWLLLLQNAHVSPKMF